jgi:hypothetical protein
MNSLRVSTVVFASALILQAGNAGAKAPHPGKKQAPAAQTSAEMVHPDASNPTGALSPYINDLDNLLALQRVGPKPKQAVLAQAPGRIVALRQQFAAEQEKAPAEAKAKWAAALQTCDLLSAALEDRSKVAGDRQASTSITGSGKLEEPSRKDNLTQGIKGGSRAKAVGAIVERDRERQAIAKGEAHAANDHSALNAMTLNQWNKRSAEWRQKIFAAYGQIK